MFASGNGQVLTRYNGLQCFPLFNAPLNKKGAEFCCTRPKLASKAQQLGLWGQDTVEAGTFWGFLNVGINRDRQEGY